VVQEKCFLWSQAKIRDIAILRGEILEEW
jgi:hypothetical protein